jgi:hypothetical protein
MINFEQLSQAFTDLLWGERAQAHMRSSIYQDKYRENSESLSVHFLVYAVCAANLTQKWRWN